ncbi:MAG: RNA helicase, partial [Alphaproteobacteria bacterium PA3]
MPISPIDGCSAEHWTEVKTIITDAIECIEDPRLKVRLVSDADDVGVIQKRIVQNLYSSDIVVCDVSGKNPNVMFELGMRLAFDKPTVIVKDDKTEYSFDTGVIEHVPYRRDLRFASVVAFKKHLADKVTATLKDAAKNPDHSTFLKNFGTFSVASLKQ